MVTVLQLIGRFNFPHTTLEKIPTITVNNNIIVKNNYKMSSQARKSELENKVMPILQIFFVLKMINMYVDFFSETGD
jgi:hypothetical protein